MCSVPVAIEHWLCDALYVSPTIAYLVSMAKSRCVKLNPFTLNFVFKLNCQCRDDIHSEQFCYTVKAAFFNILIQSSHYTEEWVVNKPLNLQP